MTMEEKPEPVIVEATLDASPEKVWRALTISDFLAAWLLPNDLSLDQGRDFAFYRDEELQEKVADCRLVEAEPYRCMQFEWREVGHDVDSVITVELSPDRDGGTCFRLVHDIAAVQQGMPANSNEPVMRLAA